MDGSWHTAGEKRVVDGFCCCAPGLVTNKGELAARLCEALEVDPSRQHVVAAALGRCKDIDTVKAKVLDLVGLDKGREVDQVLRFATISHRCTYLRETPEEVDPNSPVKKTPPCGWKGTNVVHQPHCMDVKPYLEKRWSKDLIAHMRRFGVTVIYGDYATAEDYMLSRNTAKCKTFKGRASASFTLWHPVGEPENARVIATGIDVRDKYTDLCLRLASLHLKVSNTVTVVGTPTTRIEQSMVGVEVGMQRLFKGKQVICFIGGPTRVMLALHEHLRPREDHRGDHGSRLARMKETVGVSAFSHGLIRGSFADVSIDGAPGAVLGLFVPNGELTYHLTSTLIRNGVTNLIWCGAGGAIDPKLAVGSYRAVERASIHNGGTWEIPLPRRLWPRLRAEWLDVTPGNAHVTVQSPLVETEQFVEEAENQELLSVDVELAHLFQAVCEYLKEVGDDAPLRVLGGVFISDNVRHEPLEEKIGQTDAFRHLSELASVLFEQLHVGEHAPQRIRRSLTFKR